MIKLDGNFVESSFYVLSLLTTCLREGMRSKMDPVGK